MIPVGSRTFTQPIQQNFSTKQLYPGSNEFVDNGTTITLSDPVTNYKWINFTLYNQAVVGSSRMNLIVPARSLLQASYYSFANGLDPASLRMQVDTTGTILTILQNTFNGQLIVGEILGLK